MREIEKRRNDFFLRLRDANYRDDIVISVENFLTGIGGGGGSGVYDPDIPDNVKVPQDIGGIEKDTTVGQLRGLTYEELWNRLLFPAQPPVYTNPTGILNTTLPALMEIGTSASVTFTGVFNQNDAGALDAYALLENGVQISTDNPHTIPNLTSSSPGTKSYRGEFTYLDGPIKNDNYGNPYPDGAIQAGSVLSPVRTVEFIYPVFHGAIANPSNIDLSSPAFLSGNSDKTVVKSTPNIKITFNNSTPMYLWFAVPSTTPTYTEWEINELNKGFIGSPSDLFGAPTTESLSTANYINISYKLYVSNYQTQQSEQFTIK